MERRNCITWKFSICKFIAVCAIACAASASAQAYQVTISGSAQYLDATDFGVGGATFYNPFAGPVNKSHNISLGGTTFTSNQAWTAQAMAAADLRRGEMKILAGATGAGFASAAARMVDDITFTGAYNSTYNGAACYAIPMRFVVEGTMTGNGLTSAGITVGTGALGIEMHQKVISGSTTIFSAIVSTTGTLHLDMYINTDGYIQNGVADFSHTARFGWQLPTGVNYSSGSGMFMMHAPEPATLLILGSGMLAVMRMRKKR